MVAIDLLTGESVMNIEGCGGGIDMFILLTMLVLGGDVLGWRIALRGERPLALDGGGFNMTSWLSGIADCAFSSENMAVLQSYKCCRGIAVDLAVGRS